MSDEFSKELCKKNRETIQKDVTRHDDLINKIFEKIEDTVEKINEKIDRNNEKNRKQTYQNFGMLVSSLVFLILNLLVIMLKG